MSSGLSRVAISIGWLSWLVGIPQEFLALLDSGVLPRYIDTNHKDVGVMLILQ
jgi:hypothetical protein